MKKVIILALIMLLNWANTEAQENIKNEFSESSIDRMNWFRKAQYGMFIHFGLYSQLGGYYQGKSIDKYAEWIQANADIPREEYAELAKTWTPKNFNATKIAKLAKKAGMKYLVITTKHHEGFCLWDSKYTEFDIANTPMKGRDFIQELSDACKKEGIRFGTYYSIIDWHHPSQHRNNDGKDGWAQWGHLSMIPEKKEEYITYMKNQISELIEKYDTDILWFDGDWVNWWDMKTGKELYNYFISLKPSIIMNNRIAKREQFKLDFGTPEQEHPAGELDHYWEACYTMNDSWGFKKDDDHWKTKEDIYKKLIEINGMGGNLLLNIGPDGNGNIPRESIKCLKQVGKMLKK